MKQLENHYTVDELKLRHLHVLDETCWNGAAWSQRRPQPQPASRRPVFVSRPGLAASSSNRARASVHPKVCIATTASTYPGGVGTSTNCSTGSGTRGTARCGILSSRVILGTSIPCSTGMDMSRPRKTTTGWSNHLRHRNIERRGQPAHSHPSAQRCAAAPAPAAQTQQTAGLAGKPAAGTSSTSKEKYSVPAAWGGGFARNVDVKCISLSSSPALAVFCPRRAEW